MGKSLGQIAAEANSAGRKWTRTWDEVEPKVVAHWDMIAQAVVNAHEAEKWQPISTAPKDGSVFYMLRRTAVKWSAYKQKSEQAKKGITGRWQESGDFGGWGNCEIDNGYGWQPLPQPPKDE